MAKRKAPLSETPWPYARRQKAAELIGVSQSRVSDLTRGKWEKSSLEMLITLATKAGMHVTLKTAACVEIRERRRERRMLMYKEKSIQAFVRKNGAKRSAVVVTPAVMGVSILISFIICFGMLGFRDREQLLVSSMVSVLVPAMISPFLSFGFFRLIEMLDQSEQRNKELILELQETFANMKILRGLLPICSSCKKIRNDSGYWSQLEDYIGSHSEAEFSHGICPDCLKTLYPQYARIQKQQG